MENNEKLTPLQMRKKRYFDSDEYKSMQKEIIELVKKCEINQVKRGCSLIFDDKDNVIGRVKNIEKEK